MATQVGTRASARHPRCMDNGRSDVNASAPWDCIVVGGGAAGLSAALVLGRARRRTLVVDAGRPSNAVAHGIGGLLGHDGRPPADLYAAGRAELAAYPLGRGAHRRGGRRRPGRRATSSSTWPTAPASRRRRVLLATGMDYRHADVPGLAERFGRSVFHCPFCHGWEVRDRALGVLDRGDTGVHRAQLLRAWSDDVTLLTERPARARRGGGRPAAGGGGDRGRAARRPPCAGLATSSRPSCSSTAPSGRSAACSSPSRCTSDRTWPADSARPPHPRTRSWPTPSTSTPWARPSERRAVRRG